MSLQSLQQVLGALEAQYKPQQTQPIQQVLRCWADVVGPIAAAQTRPLSIQREILQVATSSAAWAQNLVFERQRILGKLNAHLSVVLLDIRFSTAQWVRSQPQSTPFESEQQMLWKLHPSRLPEEFCPSNALLTPSGDDLTAVFQTWATILRSRSERLPLCPECRCPTPPGELERWSVCGHCAAKRWKD